MKLDKKQTPQLALLGILVILCIGYVSFQVASPRQKARPAATRAAKATAHKATPVRVAQTDASAVVLAPIPEVYPNLGTAPARRDPFVPRGMSGNTQNWTRPLNTRPINMAARATGTGSPFSGRVPFNPFRNLNNGSGPTLMPGPGSLQVRAAEPEFKLTGVVRGDSGNVAIIRTGDNNRYVVKQGQLIEGRYRVISVSDSGAVLSYGSRRIHVRLGGDKNES